MDEIVINGMIFKPREDCQYKHDYCAVKRLVDEINGWSDKERAQQPLVNEYNLYRNLILNDLWFFVYFVMKNPLANHPFIVEVCKEVEADGDRDVLDCWARDHLKTSIVTVARSMIRVFRDPEKRVGIFCHTRSIAVKILGMIRTLLEDKFLYKCFPDMLWVNPNAEAPKWSDSQESGYYVKRVGIYKEPTFSAWGLVEGMPTGFHLTDLIFDDIVTQDVQSSEMIQKVKDNFDMAENIGTRDRSIRVVGTFYRHDDPLVYIKDKVYSDGRKLFKFRKIPATVDGTYYGKSIFLPEDVLDRKRAGNQYYYYCQMLLNPSPRGHERLNKSYLVMCSKREIPERLIKFMVVDGSGDAGKRLEGKADHWGIIVVGVSPMIDQLGLNDVYILDMIIRPMTLDDAMIEIVSMYCRHGRIAKLGVEKIAMSTTEIHICSALRARGKMVSMDLENLQLLRPSSRNKDYRIESALTVPLRRGKIKILNTVPIEYVDELGMEMDHFPNGARDDGLDALSYVYDLIKEYRFNAKDEVVLNKKIDPYDRAFNLNKIKNSKNWLEL